jgi:DNA-binding transcriptional ArsR family regulator
MWGTLLNYTMAQSYAARSQAEPTPRTNQDDDCPVDSTQLLPLLGDECVMEILQAIGDTAAPARDIAETVGVSRTTVYRRLDRLQEAGLVQTSMLYNPDGHHKQQYELAVDRVHLNIGDGSLEISELA